jgi:hypothetical protein
MAEVQPSSSKQAVSVRNRFIDFKKGHKSRQGQDCSSLDLPGGFASALVDTFDDWIVQELMQATISHERFEYFDIQVFGMCYDIGIVWDKHGWLLGWWVVKLCRGYRRTRTPR